MDIKKLTTLMDWMKDTPLSEFEWCDGRESIKLVRTNGNAVMAQPAIIAAGTAQASPDQAGHANKDVVLAPFLGIVHLSGEPEGPNFVEIGQKIAAGDTLCIIEAMKVFNTVHAERGGVVKEILVQPGAQVCLDQPLFRITNT